MPNGDKLLPFVRLFCGSPSTFLWEDELGTVNFVPQGEGGERGDPLMPFFFSLKQHPGLGAVAERLRPGEHLFAFLDDVHVAGSPERSVDAHLTLGRRNVAARQDQTPQRENSDLEQEWFCPREC